ncbi:MAG: hypothetical protein FWF67_00465 [Fibromonadales bacterium]|nr:hypothetical protein [Fibromonadales bacterium]
MIEEDEVPDKAKVQYEHLKRVKEHMAEEEAAREAAKVIKGADTKNYKKFKDGYIPPPEMELSDEEKLKLTRNYQALNGFMGFVCIVITFFIIYKSPLHISVLENFIIVLNIYNSTLHLALLENYLVIEINLILLGCALVATNIAGIISFQHKHDKISDRVNSGRSNKPGVKKIMYKNQGLIRTMGGVGLFIILLSIYCSSQHISLLENFVILLSIHDSTLHISLFESIVINVNLILLGCVLAATSLGLISFRHRISRISNRIGLGSH